MRRVAFKVCCTRSVDEAELAFDAGAAAVGLVSAMPSGPGVIDDTTIAEVTEAMAGRLETFLLTSETTAAATGAVGVVRRDPMAMKPFCGYNFGDYFAHWLNMGKKSDKAPKIFHVNWFRQDDQGNFIWPGFGENMRVLEWVLKRCADGADAVETPIGHVPAPGTIDLEGIDVDEITLERLLGVDPEAWQGELAGQKEFLEQYGDRMPKEMWSQFEALKDRLSAVSAG